MNDLLKTFGWNDRFAALFAPHADNGFDVGRVLIESRASYRVVATEGECEAVLSGKMHHNADSKADFPAVGDWVVLHRPENSTKRAVLAVLDRQTKFSRKVPGFKTDEQVIAANVDVVFLVSGLDRDFNPRRIERYLALAWESGAKPVIILNKSDICEDPDEKVESIEAFAIGVPVLLMSALQRENVERVREFLHGHKTGALLGSSGVGKSTLLNALMGESRQEVRAVREADQRGRHTTTHRELFKLPDGGLIIDTPGLRELQLWEAGQGMQDAFEDIDALAATCKFRDCRHEMEPGCAVKVALDAGEIDARRYRNFLKLQRELEHLERRKDEKAAFFERRRERELHREYKRIIKASKKS